MTSLLIQTAFLGDVVLTTPLLQVLADREGPLDVVTTPGARPLLETHPAVRRVIPYDKRGEDRGWTGFARMVRQLRRGRYPRAWLPHRSWRSGALAVFAGIGERIGFTDGARTLYTRSVPRPSEGHEVERLLALAEPGDSPAPPVRIMTTDDDERAAREWLDGHGVRPGFIAVAPGSIWGTKRWPYYEELALRLDRDVVAVGGPDDHGLGDRAAHAAGSRGHNAAGSLSLRASTALIARAAALITNDSAPLHLATAAGTPVIALFGPTIPAFGFGPRGPADEALGVTGLGCRPCSRHGPQVCPLGHHHCMRHLDPETVEKAAFRVLAATAGRKE
ncbi:MAG: glycosyltransferase family 9 protein [Gemmatimonadales bacterium]